MVKLDNAEMFEMLWSEIFSNVRLVKPDNAEREWSEMLLLSRNRTLRLVKPDKGERSEMLLFSSRSRVRLVKPLNGEMFEILLSSRNRTLRCVKPDKGERSDTELLLVPPFSPSGLRYSSVRLIAWCSPVKLLMLVSGASSRVNLAISVVVIVAPLPLPKACSILTRRFRSGIFTEGSGGGGSN